MKYEVNPDGGFMAIPENPEEERKLQEFVKKMAMVWQIHETSESVIRWAKRIPDTGKKKNVFRKTYDRRPQNKSKRLVGVSGATIAATMGAINLLRIASQPIPPNTRGCLKRSYDQCV